MGQWQRPRPLPDRKNERSQRRGEVLVRVEYSIWRLHLFPLALPSRRSVFRLYWYQYSRFWRANVGFSISPHTAFGVILHQRYTWHPPLLSPPHLLWATSSL